MTTTATVTDTDVLAGLDYAPVCEAANIWTFGDVVIKTEDRGCENPAEVIITIHRWTDHTYRTKLYCLSCLLRVDQDCYAGCGAPNITAVQPIPGRHAQ